MSFSIQGTSLTLSSLLSSFSFSQSQVQKSFFSQCLRALQLYFTASSSLTFSLTTISFLANLICLLTLVIQACSLLRAKEVSYSFYKGSQALGQTVLVSLLQNQDLLILERLKKRQHRVVALLNLAQLICFPFYTPIVMLFKGQTDTIRDKLFLG